MTRPKLMTSRELSEKYGITPTAVVKKMKRHGYKQDAKRRYKESEFIQARQLGAQMDKATATEKLKAAEAAGESLPAQKLRKQIRLLELDIEMSEAKLAEMHGRVIELDKHKEHCQAIAKLMLTWWDQASESAATKIKDATVLDELRRAGERARQEILDFTD